MLFSKPRVSGLRIVLLTTLGLQIVLDVARAEFTKGIVASVNPLATEAGVAVLKSGGNAVDAGVAVALTLGVVDGQNSGIGGGCFFLIHQANGTIVAIDGRETAPAAATRDMFVGKAEASQYGALASGVPGALAAYEYAVEHFGRRKFKDLIDPAAELAENGFIITSSYAAALQSVSNELGRIPSSRRIFYNDDKVLRQGERLRQPDLAQTYRQIGLRGSRWFYRGPFAQAVDAWMKANGGILTAEDMNHYSIKLRPPVFSTYHEYQIVGFPPPSSGGTHVAQILNILENFSMKSLDGPTRLHIAAEAMKLAFADRAYWLGDSDFTHVPSGLTDKRYAKELASRIKPQQVTEVGSHGNPPDWEELLKKHTTHLSVADADGNWVACTTTVNTSFGSKVVIPGTGVVMNDQMDDFSIHPGTTNFFGLLGAEANEIVPGKRPLSSMSPTLVLKNGQPIIALGAAGGPRIISTVVLELIQMLDLGASPETAVAEPRIHQQWFPNEVLVEGKLSSTLKGELAKRGHKLHEESALSISQIVARSKDGKSFVGAADPRAGGSVGGW